MPAIRQYENQASLKATLNPQDAVNAGNSALSAANARGRATSALGETIGGAIKDVGEQYQEFRAQQEISHGLATAAQIQANVSEAWNNYAKSADPNDPSTAERFREEDLEPILQSFASGFQTKRARAWADAQVGALRQHFFERTAADQSSMAGMAAVKNIQTFQASASNSAQSDPSSVNFLLGSADTAIEGILGASPNLTVTQQASLRGQLRDGMRKEILTSGFMGMARADPDAAQAALAKGYGAVDLDGTDREKLFGFAASIKNAKEADARAAAQAAKQAEKDDADKKATAIAASMYNPDGTLSVKPGTFQALTELANHPGTQRSDIQALQNAMQAATQDSINGTTRFSDPATYQSLASRIGIPKGSPGALQAAEVDKAYLHLAPVDYRFLRQAAVSEADGSSTVDAADKAAVTSINAALERVKPLITKSTMFKIDQTGVANYDAMYYDTHQRFAALKAQGKTSAEAAAILTDPRNPEGIQNTMAPYQTNNKQAMQNLRARTSQGGGPTGPTRVEVPVGLAPKAGETPEAYLKRTQGGTVPDKAVPKPAPVAAPPRGTGRTHRYDQVK